MPESLELPHLVEQHGMAEMQIGRGRIETGLDAQAPAALQTLREFGFEQNFVRTAPQERQCFSRCGHARAVVSVFCGGKIITGRDILAHATAVAESACPMPSATGN